MRKNLLIIFLLLAFSLAFSQEVKHKIVFQVVSGDSLVHKMLIHNLQNITQEWKDDVKIEVVLHGPGVSMAFKEKQSYESKIKELLKLNVNFLVCENTLKQKKIEKSLIFESVSFVKLGIGHIVERQESGWSYIKSGY
ncbi:MAG: DsrE family protein [Cytophagales bacterium]